MSTHPTTPESNALAAICREWYISFGFVTLAIALSLWVHPLWMPLVELLLSTTLAMLGPGRNSLSTQPCGRITYITIYTLMFTGIISFIIVVFYRTEFIHLFFDISTLNHSIPYITSLIIFPVGFVLTLVLNSKYIFNLHVRNCHLHKQYNPEQPMFGRFVHATYRSILHKLTLIYLAISLLDWAYYLLYYENVSINSPDKFFFFAVPCVVYVASILYVRQRYTSLRVENGRTINASSDPNAELAVKAVTNTAIMRYFIVKGNTLLLNVGESTILNRSIDTPIVELKPLPYDGTVEEAKHLFEHHTGLSAFEIKELYVSTDNVHNNIIHHFLVNISENTSTPTLYGTWVQLDGIDNLMRMGVFAPQFADEFYHIYTVSLAARTYYRDGRRRFPIRNYRPTFRLEGLRDVDVDYNDPHWLKVSRINQDASLWFLRKHKLKEKK